MLKLKFFNQLFLRKLNFCVLPKHASQKIEGMELVQHHHILLVIVFTEKNTMKNISHYLVTISIPKVAKIGQKVPIMAKSENGVVS